MKNIIIGLVLGLLINGLICYAQERIVMNPLQYLGSSNNHLEYYTTKITTPEGVYRIFSISKYSYGCGITAIKIN